jgi:hypothetical protein
MLELLQPTRQQALNSTTFIFGWQLGKIKLKRKLK